MARRRRGGLREQHPSFFAFGDTTRYLSKEEEVSTPRDERIRSVWPFLVEQTLKFYKGLKPRERANYDPEDLLLEVYLVLASKDAKWSPDRGRYITFAGTVAERTLYAIRDKSRTIHGPRNSACRLRGYEAKEAEGTLTAPCRKTAADIRRVSQGEIERFEHNDRLDQEETPEDVAAADEARRLSADEAAVLVGTLPPYEAAVLGLTCGLWGSPEMKDKDIAARMGKTMPMIRKIREAARRRLRERAAQVAAVETTKEEATRGR